MIISIDFVWIALVLVNHCKHAFPLTDLIILFEDKSQLIHLIDLERLIFMTFKTGDSFDRFRKLFFRTFKCSDCDLAALLALLGYGFKFEVMSDLIPKN
jgi:hypothetical protein